MSTPTRYIDDDKPLQVKRGRVDSVNLYEVKENELDILENGEPTGIYLNFAIFLLSLAFSGILALCSATFDNGTIKNVFLFVAIIGVIGGVFLLILWWRGRKSIKSIIQRIKDRIPPDNSSTLTISEKVIIE
jgi:hypothetical protein